MAYSQERMGKHTDDTRGIAIKTEIIYYGTLGHTQAGSKCVSPLAASPFHFALMPDIHLSQK